MFGLIVQKPTNPTFFFDEKATLEELKLQIIFFVDFRCYAMMGSFSESAQYLKVCLPAIQERYGPHSIEVGHELIKYTDVLLGKEFYRTFNVLL